MLSPSTSAFPSTARLGIRQRTRLMKSARKLEKPPTAPKKRGSYHLNIQLPSSRFSSLLSPLFSASPRQESFATPSSAPLTPETPAFQIKTEADQRRRKIEKLSNTLGESRVPPQLVFQDETGEQIQMSEPEVIERPRRKSMIPFGTFASWKSRSSSAAPRPPIVSPRASTPIITPSAPNRNSLPVGKVSFVENKEEGFKPLQKEESVKPSRMKRLSFRRSFSIFNTTPQSSSSSSSTSQIPIIVPPTTSAKEKRRSMRAQKALSAPGLGTAKKERRQGWNASWGSDEMQEVFRALRDMN
ncbi:hypothetical protein SERLA73DRAFT_188855 [Serpula lacrymans var. lacrymans S7.3]|uniref:Uncharacterized protein n=1 Tax=Serpula lacrymans var. lacrymans (strain S7.3) TaxID=936435 RepID=F8QCA9_SERL3|nr:hypothetical protein SERLA73DRAFT_188855 [Serpula lacrymans var. lacrymans S7.3]